MTGPPSARTVPLPRLALYFLTLGAIGFGGPAALADRMRRDLVEIREWITREEFDLGLTIAAACPGPLAYQLAVYCGYARHGATGAYAVGMAFALVPFALVVAVAASYETWSTSLTARGLFFGAGPVVVALICRACWNLGRRTLHRAPLAWATCATAAAITWTTGREPLWMFALAGLLGAFLLRPSLAGSKAVAGSTRGHTSGAALLAVVFEPPGMLTASTSAQLFGFFFKTGCLVFGSGLVIVPFLRSAVVDSYHWIGEQQFLDSVTVGLVSPGPVVITATFVGYLVARLPGAIAATTGMFLPAVLFTIIAAPWFERRRQSPVLLGFVRGITAAVVGVLAGTVPLVAGGAVPDAAAAAILVAATAVMTRWRLPDPMLVALGGAGGVAILWWRG
ncbi:MAG TPA: chromate efflux transporter [Vicinamibacterales bacterium]|nr:chromate efflux transporter [Vicinamibacterales bacterium]